MYGLDLTCHDCPSINRVFCKLNDDIIKTKSCECDCFCVFCFFIYIYDLVPKGRQEKRTVDRM